MHQSTLMMLWTSLRPSRSYNITTQDAQFQGVLVGLYQNIGSSRMALFRRWDGGTPVRVPLSQIVNVAEVMPS
jgi:hypothetical protein